MLIDKWIVKQFKILKDQFLKDRIGCNLYDIDHVHTLANRLGFSDLVDFIDTRGWEGYRTLLEDYPKWMEIYEIENETKVIK